MVNNHYFGEGVRGRGKGGERVLLQGFLLVFWGFFPRKEKRFHLWDLYTEVQNKLCKRLRC